MRLRTAALMLAWSVAAFAQAGSTVEGRVISTVRGEPVANVQITMRPQPITVETAAAPMPGRGAAGRGGPTVDVYVCLSGSDGAFKFVGVAPGRYSLRPAKSGFEMRSTGPVNAINDVPTVTVEAGKNATMEIRMTPQSAVSGRVVDEDGDPLRGGQVSALQYAYVRGKRELQIRNTTQVDSRGVYRLFHLTPGRYYIRAQPQSPGAMNQGERIRGPHVSLGFAPSYYPGTPDAAQAAELDLAPGVELRNIQIRATPVTLHSIRGSYVPEPDAYVNVQALRANGNQRGMMGMVDYGMNFQIQGQVQALIAQAQAMGGQVNMPGAPTPGTFQVDGLEPGKYIVQATMVKRIQPSQLQQQPPQQIGPRQQPEQYTARQEVEVLNRDVDGIVLTFEPPVKVSGTIRVEGGAAVDFRSLGAMLVSEERGPTGAEQVKPDGTFEWTLSAGKYRFQVASQQAYLKSMRAGKEEMPGGHVDTSRLREGLTIVLSQDFGSVEGTITGADGKPVVSANVTLLPDQRDPDWPDRYKNNYTNAAGVFRIANIVPGEYRVYAWIGAEPGAPQSAEFRKPFEEHATVVKVEANGKLKLDLKPIVVGGQ